MTSTAYTVELSERELEALFEDERGRGWPAESLERAGALVGGELQPGLVGGLRAVSEPICELAMARGRREGNAWVKEQWSALVVPAGEQARWRLHVVPTEFLPAVLARLNDLGPRPRHRPAVRLRFAAGGLAAMLASGDPSAVASGGNDNQRAAARGLVAGLREHWRVEARWEPSRGSPGVRALEVIDTVGGLWLVVPDGGDVELWPAAPTLVWRQLTALLPRDEDLGRVIHDEC